VKKKLHPYLTVLTSPTWLLNHKSFFAHELKKILQIIMENQIENLNLEIDNHYDIATKSQRLIHYLIDVVIIVLIMFAVITLLNFTPLAYDYLDKSDESDLKTRLIVLIILLLYYTITELTFKKTFGKMLTQTHVIRKDGMPLTFKNCLLRSLSRIVPFEAISVFVNNGVMWHDNWTDTYVVKDRN
jgi:uncharacterized RDD family membrane protein YckC